MVPSLEASARQAVDTLRRSGHLAYFVGGCIRDQLLGLEARDYDVVTDATASEICALFPKTIPVGAAFGTVVVVQHGYEFEVSTFRGSDRTEERDPERLIELDAGHRDFTINALVSDPETHVLYDPVGGRRDIAEKIIRAVHNPFQRFAEDPLRMLRAIRFAVQLGFALDSATDGAIQRQAPDILLSSPERIQHELVGILLSPDPARGFRLLHATGLLHVLLPEVAAMEGVAQPPEFHPEGDVWTHTLLMLEHLGRSTRESDRSQATPLRRPSPELALAVLLHDVGKPPTFRVADRIRFDRHPEIGARIVQAIAERYRWPRERTERVLALVADHLLFMNVLQMRRSTLVRWLRKPHFPDLLELHRLDCLGSHRSLETYDLCRRALEAITLEERRPPRLLTGDDLKHLGYAPGPRYKEILDAVEDAQLEGVLHTQEDATAWVTTRYPIS